MILLPLQGQIVITQRFGLNPKVYKQFGLKGHNGIDFRAKVGTSVYAPFDGMMTVGDQGKSGYGKFVRIRTDRLDCVLAHLSQINDGNGHVCMGDPIGISGNTGFSTGAHLHMGLRILDDGMNANPKNGFLGYVDFEEWLLTWRRMN